MSDTTQVRRSSRWWYALALAIGFVGCGASAGLGFYHLDNKLDSMHRGVMPGKLRMELASGSYTVYHEQRSTVDGKLYSSTDIGGLRCRLTDTASHTPVELSVPSTSTSYEFGSRKGASVWSFDIAHDGTYELQCVGQDGRQPTPVVLAVGDGVGGMIVMTLLGMFGSALVGGVGMFIVYRKRKR